MGYALAGAFADLGLDVTLISGPVSLATPPQVRRLDVISADDMCESVLRELPAHDALIMVAAVADWRPKVISTEKLKKHTMQPTIELERTRDILKTVHPLKEDRLFVGFAAETEALIEHAREKMASKELDGIIANDVGAAETGMASDLNAVTALPREGEPLTLQIETKNALAPKLAEWILALASA